MTPFWSQPLNSHRQSQRNSLFEEKEKKKEKKKKRKKEDKEEEEEEEEEEKEAILWRPRPQNEITHHCTVLVSSHEMSNALPSNP